MSDFVVGVQPESERDLSSRQRVKRKRLKLRTESERDYSYPLHEKNRFQFLEKGGG